MTSIIHTKRSVFRVLYIIYNSATMAFSVNKSKSIMVRKLCEEDLTREDLILGNISKESFDLSSSSLYDHVISPFQKAESSKENAEAFSFSRAASRAHPPPIP